MKSKFSVGDIVLLKHVQIKVKILEVVLRKNNFFYKLDWTPYGYNQILNTVHIAESAVYET